MKTKPIETCNGPSFIPDPDLSARANAELVKGFPVKVYHHAD